MWKNVFTHDSLAFGLGRHLAVMTAVSTALTEFIRASALAKSVREGNVLSRMEKAAPFQSICEKV